MTADKPLTNRDLTLALRFMQEHEGHDVGTRHEDGALYSATCHDCHAQYWRGPTAGMWGPS